MNPKVDWFFDKPTKCQEAYRELRELALSVELAEELKWGCPCYSFKGSKGYEDGGLLAACPAVLGTAFEIVRKEETQKGFKVQKKRGVVERSHAWHGEKRRLALDYE